MTDTASKRPGFASRKNAWLEIMLDEGRNRQIRRLREALDGGVLRLVHTAIGGLPSGELLKGQWREEFGAAEIALLDHTEFAADLGERGDGAV